MRSRVLIIVLLTLALLPTQSAAQAPSEELISISGYAPNIVVSPDGRWLAVWDEAAIFQIQGIQPTLEDKAVQLINVETGDVRTLQGSPNNLYADLAFSPDSTSLVGSNRDGYLYHWDLENDTPVSILPSLTLGAYIDFKDDNTVIMMAGGVPQVITQDLRDGDPTLIMTRHFSFEESLGDGPRNILRGPFDLSPDRSRITFVLQQGDVWVWNLDTREQQMIVEPSVDPERPAPIGDVDWAIFLNDNAVLYANRADDTLYRVDLDSGQQSVFASPPELPNYRAAFNGEVIVWLAGDELNVLSEEGFSSFTNDGSLGRLRSVAIGADKVFISISSLDSDGQSTILIGELEEVMP